MRTILFISLYTIISAIVYAQRDDDLESYIKSLTPFVIEYQKVAFVTADSTYKFTRFITANGEFSFMEGFDNPGYTTDYTLFVFGKKKSENLYNLEAGNYRISYKSVSDDIDTIYSYIPIKDKEYIKIGHSEDSLLDIYDELEYSYILRQIGETNKISLMNNTIRVLYPCEELNSCTSYRIITLRFFEDSVKIYGLTASSVDHNGIQLIRQFSGLLQKRDVKKITKELNRIKPIEDITCRIPGNPWFLEYNDGAEYKRYIISNYCLRDKKDLRPIAFLCYLILGTGKNYW